MPTVSVSGDAYQDLDRIRQRVDYEGTDLFDDNAAIRFDELLVELEIEARGVFMTLWGDETVLEETGRTDTLRTTDDAAIPLVYPINDVTKVEYKVSVSSDWEELDTDKYDFTEHRLVLAHRSNNNRLRYAQSGNSLRWFAGRATWRDLAAKLRVTYDRGFTGGAPADVKSIQVQLINRLLRDLKREQTVAAASPEELAGQQDVNEILTDEIRNRISDVTSPGRATMSV